MAQSDIKQIAEKLKAIDFSMLATSSDGDITSRPMSNNGDVEYDGDAWYFTYEDSQKVRDIQENPLVSSAYQGAGKGGAPGAFISVDGHAELVTDKAEMKKHWYDDLQRWFPDGLDTQGIAMIKVHASRIRWWDGEENGDFTVD